MWKGEPHIYYAVAEVFYDADDNPSGYAPVEDLYAESLDELQRLVTLIYTDIVERVDDDILPVIDAADHEGWNEEA